MITLRNSLTFFYTICLLFYFNSCIATNEISKDRQNGPLYSFIFCNDLHISTPEEGQFFSAIVHQWNSFTNLYDFVIIGGDMVNDGTVEELLQVRKILEQLKRPYFTLVGNHDVSGRGPDGKHGYREVYGMQRENYSIIHKKTALIMLDLSMGLDANVGIDTSMCTWLRETLEIIPAAMPVLVFSHFPLHPLTPQFPVQNSDSLFSLLDSRLVLGYFSGHYHAFLQLERNSVPFFTNTCLSLRRDNHDGSADKGYLLVTVYSSHITTQFYKQGSFPVAE